MNRKQLILLLVLVVVLGGAGLIIRKQQNQSWVPQNSGVGKKLLGDLPVNDVARLSLKQGTNELNLVKKENLWRVRERNDYPAAYSEIRDFLIKAGDLKIGQIEKVGPSQLGRFELAAGQGTNAALTVEFKDQADKTLRSLLLGKKHMRKSDRPSPYGAEFGGDQGYPDGRYVKVGDSGDVALISDALANIEPKPEQWLDKEFFKVEKIRGIAVAFPAGTNSWKLTRESESGEWKLADAKPGESLDPGKASGTMSPLSSPSFADVATAKPEELGLDKPTIVTVDTFDEFTYTLKVGAKTNENYPMAMTVAAALPKERAPGKDEKAEDKDKLDKEFKEKQKKLEEKLAAEKGYEKWVYLVSNYSLEPLLKDRSALMAEKKEEKKPDAAGTATPESPLTLTPPVPLPSGTEPPPAPAKPPESPAPAPPAPAGSKP
ncbi:MAG TPA: DUF4340 domain-containing protein [Methylomirabilota bacterium]|nr:DUF4340 domain-containing protein [Methylomirabilota bacterium]